MEKRKTIKLALWWVMATAGIVTSGLALAYNERTALSSVGPFSLYPFWSGQLGETAEVHSLSVNHLVDMVAGNMEVVIGQPINYAYSVTAPFLSMGGGKLEEKGSEQAWREDLSWPNDCPATPIEYVVEEETYQFKACAIKPAISIQSDNTTIINCSGLNCATVGVGTANITATTSSIPYKIWGKKVLEPEWTEIISGDLPAQNFSWNINVLPPPPTLDFNSTKPLPIEYGTSTTLAWTTTNATSCTASGEWSGTKGTSGNYETDDLYGTKKYTLSCSGPGGSITKTVEVTVGSPVPVPTVSFTVAASPIPYNTGTTLQWSSQNADSCVATGDWTGDKPLSGNESTGNLTANKFYSLTCVGDGGAVRRDIFLVVEAPVLPLPTLNFQAFRLGYFVIFINWSSQNTTACTASGYWTGSKPVSGSEVISDPDYLPRNLTLTCDGPGGSVSHTLTVKADPLPILNFTANSTNINYKDSVTLTWSSENTTSCTASNGWSGSKPLSGTQTYTLTTTTTFALTCSGPAGSVSRSVRITVGQPPGDPVLNFYADSYTVNFNGGTTLRWQVDNVRYCSGTGDWSKWINSNGSYAVNNLISNKTYILTCYGAGSKTVSQSVTIIVNPPPDYSEPPTLNFTVDASNLDPGGSTTLRWTSTRAHYCTATGDWTGNKPLSGNQSTGSLVRTMTYILTCSNNVGSVAKSVTVTIPTLIINFSADVNPIPFNTFTTLRWSTKNATTCSASDGWSGTKSTSGSERTVNLTTDTSFTLYCEGAYGSGSLTINVLVKNEAMSAPGISFWADSFSVMSGKGTTLRWATTNADNCTALGDWSGVINPAGGSFATGNLTAAKKYILTCYNAAGGTSMGVTVSIGTSTPGPNLSFWADSINLATGQSTKLHWRSENSTSCKGDWTPDEPNAPDYGDVAMYDKHLSSNANTENLNQWKSYTLTCQGPGGTIASTVTIAVGEETPAAPSLNFWADSYYITSGDNAVLRWDSSNANYGCQPLESTPENASADDPWSGAMDTNGYREITGLTETTSYPLQCRGEGGEITAIVTIIPINFIICPETNVILKDSTAQLKAWYNPESLITCQTVESVDESVEVTNEPEISWWSDDTEYVEVDDDTQKGEIEGKQITDEAVEIHASYKNVETSVPVSVITLKECWICHRSQHYCEKHDIINQTQCPDGEYGNLDSCAVGCAVPYREN